MADATYYLNYQEKLKDIGKKVMNRCNFYTQKVNNIVNNGGDRTDNTIHRDLPCMWKAKN